ncbi:MAG: glycosyl transferase [Flavobacteriaceae bacterium CG_4_10_14_3_um_filter_33_47]|nr:MAG: glycosyl transferase [Flavobacteriaceae bacterium CG17_big_fil_post_rev_8_21_14_2_50_33_15]PIY12813.1 MAG: glycosyl transferase [Flavobacteriaceae bacterium CG_4_10_14_3_um_filter_33_47]PJB19866.1 MAG: glycosyl transferase [Flavobacteriaceae bacterium CG_4_9_14_3_um_filter_33_16]
MSKFSVLITTKNRLEYLKFTLQKLDSLINRVDVECIICDDGSTDGTYGYIKENFPSIQLIRHKKSRGLIASRNELLHLTKATYAITLDDDAHIVSQNPLEIIETFFESNKKCAVMAFRIFWGKDLPENVSHNLENTQVKGFVGCGHAWNMQAWNDIPNYPNWFMFYGEEDFASYHLFKKKWQVHFVPNILVHHRVDIKKRKKNPDYQTRLRRSLRSGWYLYVLFYPWQVIPRKFLYTLWIQFKSKVFKGDFKAFLAIILALCDVVINIPRLMIHANRFSKKEFLEYSKQPNTIIYWTSK